ncbi:MAG: transcription termination factor Rho, partial [Atopobiaceae bacterium]|nr:transcription termination factor Rho [Atopobiaceae bacterium]
MLAPVQTLAEADLAASVRTVGDGQSRSRKRRRSGSQNGQNNQGNQNHVQNNQRQNNQIRNRRRRGGAADVNREPSLTIEELSEMKVAELRAKAAEVGLDASGLKKAELIEAIFHKAAVDEGFRQVRGILDIQNEGYGFLRTGNYMQGDDDAFVYQQIIRQYGLRTGDEICGTVVPNSSNLKFPPLSKIESVNGRPPEEMLNRPRFKDLTPVFPDERLVMEHGKDSITGRAIDLVAPIGKGQRGLIVSPPKAGKTTILKRICESIAANNPEVHLICLLVDERPEEVTDMQRSIKGEVVASTFDMPADNHTAVAELSIERAKRLVEQGEDVVVVLDSITRLARAYNLAAPASGRILSGGVESAALYPPTRCLGAARHIEGGGSLTIIASALIDTGSK